MTLRDSDVFKSDVLALWYFRLNGVFTIPNFVLHPESSGSARTDADIAGVRYPFRAEFSTTSGLDDEWFEKNRSLPCAVIAEVKTSECAINGPWSSRKDDNITKVLSDLGWYAPNEVDTASSALYDAGRYEGAGLVCSLFCIGNSSSNVVRKRYPCVPQRTWSEIAEWIFDRFTQYAYYKKDHDQWDAVGKALWKHFKAARKSRADFEAALRRRFLLRNA